MAAMIFAACNSSSNDNVVLYEYEVVYTVHYPSVSKTYTTTVKAIEQPRVYSSKGSNYLRYVYGECYNQRGNIIETSAPIEIISISKH